MASGVPTVSGEPAPKYRAQVRFFVLAFVVVQALVPLRYYLGNDPYDERFSWRMFSAVRVHRCRAGAMERVSGVDRPIDLQRVVGQAWLEALQRNRAEVVEGFLRYRCGEEGVERVVMRNQCIAPDGAQVPLIEWTRDCESGEVEVPEITLGGGS